NSAFYGGYETGDAGYQTGMPSRIEGIGRPRVEPSFVGQVVDRMIEVPDAASIAAMRYGSRVLGRRIGGSTGTNLWGVFHLIGELLERGRSGSVVTVLSDGGDRSASTYYADARAAAQGWERAGPTATREECHATGVGRGWPPDPA